MGSKIKIVLFIILISGLSHDVVGQSVGYEPAIIGIENMYYHPGKLKGFKDGSSVLKSEVIENNRWTPLSGFTNKDLTSRNEIWIKVKLPDTQYNNRAVSIISYLNRFEVYMGVRIEEFNIEADGTQYRYYGNHIIPIPESFDTGVITIRIFYNIPANFGKIYTIIVGDKEDLYQDIINDQSHSLRDIIDEILLGFVLFIFGTVSIFVFLIRLKSLDYPFLSFGLFAIFSGIRYLCGIRLLQYINISPITFLLIENISFLLIPVTLFAFVEQIFGSNKSKIIRRISQFHLIIAIVTVILILKNIPYEPFVIPLLLLSSVICFYFILKSDKEISLNVKLPFLAFLAILISLVINEIGESIFGIFFINNIVQYLFNISWKIDIFGWGILGLTFALSYILIRHYTNLIKHIQSASIELEKNRSEILELGQAKLESQFDALKNQLNPHFLFNNFSTLISIIEENSESAVNFVQELANVYRYILKTRISELVDLNTEIEFVYSYEYLMQQRFGENIKLSVDILDEHLNLMLPPFSLQLLIENAIKHNIISKRKPLKMEIYEENSYIVVKNNLQKKNVIEGSTNIGLSNIEKRYKFFTSRDIYIIPDEKNFIVKLPLLDRKDWLNYANYNN
jgi:sensor histidine kinase YesM